MNVANNHIFDNALTNGISSVRSALAGSDQDGPKEDYESKLSILFITANSIWKNMAIVMQEFLEKIAKLNESVSPHFKKFTKIKFEVDDEVRFKDLRKGYWHTPLFLRKGYHHCGLKLSPNKNLKQWATIHQEGYDKVKTISPNLATFLNLFIFINLRHENVYNLTRNNFDKFEQDLSLVYNELSNQLYLEKFKDFIFKNEYSDFGSIENLYIELLQYVLGDAAKNFVGLLRKLIEDVNYLPSEDELEENEIFKPRIVYGSAIKAIKLTLSKHRELSKIQPLLWKAFEQIHVYDVEGYDFKILPDEILNMVSIAGEFANRLSKKESITDEIYSPLHAVALNLYDYSGARTYKGVQHMEAAALYDLEFNDPIRSWNCLVNAAFWSGLNTKETFMPAWDAAIYLAEKNEWNDVHEALVWQKDFYNNFKKKNNLP